MLAYNYANNPNRPIRSARSGGDAGGRRPPTYFGGGRRPPTIFWDAGGRRPNSVPPLFLAPPPTGKMCVRTPPGREFPMENFRFVAPPTGKISVPTPPLPVVSFQSMFLASSHFFFSTSSTAHTYMYITYTIDRGYIHVLVLDFANNSGLHP